MKLQLPLAVLTLLAGAMIYLLFGNPQLLGFRFADAIGLGTMTTTMREAVSGVKLPEFVVYCLPDGLWSVSYILFADHTCKKEPAKYRCLAASAIPVIGAVSEVMQLLGWLPGVYDTRDLLCYLIPYLIYICYEKR